MVPVVSTEQRTNGHTIRAVRRVRGIRQDELAAAALMSKGYLCNVELGRRHPLPDMTARIAAVLDVDPEILTGQRPAIALLRTALGLSPRELATDIGVTTGRLQRIEQGADLPGPDLLAVIATRLGVDVAALQRPTSKARSNVA